MSISLSEFLSQLFSNPALAITVLLTLGVIMVNGWTDAPNAIATCVSTRSMGVRAARRMSSVNWGVVREMMLAWILTFPGCGIIGYLMSKLFIAIF